MKSLLNKVVLLAGLLFFGACALVGAQTIHTEEVDFRLTMVTDSLNHPWAVAFLPDGDYLVSERRGRLYRVRSNGSRSQLAGVPGVSSGGQGGLLDVVLHPDFAKNNWVYLSYARPVSGGAATALGRGRLQGDELQDFEHLFTAQPGRSGGRHFGSRIVFDHDGYVYLTIGDRGDMDSAQDPANHQGTTVRLYDDGSVPQDNPFFGQVDYRPEIYTYGNRNAQGMIVHPETGDIWQNEHGPQGGDELNLIRGGLNYGWPVVTTGEQYGGGRIGIGESHESMEDPVVDWTPSIAPSGMAYYGGEQFPAWHGNFFIGALAGQHLRRVVLEGNEVVHQEELLSGRVGRIRDVRSSPDGYLYLLTDSASGVLYRLEPVD